MGMTLWIQRVDAQHRKLCVQTGPSTETELELDHTLFRVALN